MICSSSSPCRSTLKHATFVHVEGVAVGGDTGPDDQYHLASVPVRDHTAPICAAGRFGSAPLACPLTAGGASDPRNRYRSRLICRVMTSLNGHTWPAGTCRAARLRSGLFRPAEPASNSVNRLRVGGDMDSGQVAMTCVRRLLFRSAGVTSTEGQSDSEAGKAGLHRLPKLTTS